MKPMEFFLVGLMLFVFTNTTGQNIFVYAEQELNFGEFYLSNDSRGEISITHTGEWTASGNINLLNSTHHPAVFIISTDSRVPIKVEVEAFVQKLRNPKGNEMQINLQNFKPLVYILQAGLPVQIVVGGTLIVNSKAASSSGDYRGSISLSIHTLNEK